jgi:hypothetical protein
LSSALELLTWVLCSEEEEEAQCEEEDTFVELT